MKSSLAILAVGLTCVMAGQEHEQPAKMERLCGSLRHSEEVPVRGAPNTFTQKTRGLKGVRMELYPREEGHGCCVGVAIATLSSGRSGRFHFKDVAPGEYWLVALVDSRRYEMPIKLERRNKKEPRRPCSEQWFDIFDSGEFGFGVTIVLDGDSD